MSIFKATLEPSDVFNPRGEYNPEMYVTRPKYEQAFSRALTNDTCILVHGQSGTGKTWLTRRMLQKEKIYYKVVNLANASNFDSIYLCLKNMMIRDNWQIRTGRTERMNAEANAFFASGQIETTKMYEENVDYFMEFLKYMSYRAQNKEERKYIVFENMEAILCNDKLIKELANLITLIDDDEVAKYNIKFIIIGATKDIHQYFRKVLNVNTIDNRINELPDVGTLTVPQARELIVRGFDKLELKFSESLKEVCVEEYIRITGGIPQRIHELCLTFAQIARASNKSLIENDEILQGKKEWINTSLNKNYAYISRLIDKGGSENTFKNKVLYCVAQMDTLYFTNEKIDRELELEFPDYTQGKKISSTKVLNELCKCTPPLLNKIDDGFGEYSFVDFKCALCIRAILEKRGSDVYKNDIYDI